jgi:hypothetical protein
MPSCAFLARANFGQAVRANHLPLANHRAVRASRPLAAKPYPERFDAWRGDMVAEMFPGC